MTTPSRLSPVGLLSPVTPSSPPSEMSAPLSSLATSVPSMAASPSGEEERPCCSGPRRSCVTNPVPISQAIISATRLTTITAWSCQALRPALCTLWSRRRVHSRTKAQPQHPPRTAQNSAERPTAPEPVSSSNSGQQQLGERDRGRAGGRGHAVSWAYRALWPLDRLFWTGWRAAELTPRCTSRLKHDLQSRLTAVMVIQDPIAVWKMHWRKKITT